MSDFKKLVGQLAAIELLQCAIVYNRIAPAYLFVGAAGVGRGLAAKCFTCCLLSLGLPIRQHLLIAHKVDQGNHPDLLWIQPTYQHQGKFLTAAEAQEAGLKRKSPPQIRIEQIREITRFLARPPLEAPRTVVVIEEAHTMTEAAANALLKTLEEPGRSTLILIAPSSDLLLPTLVSRCQRIPFSRLSDGEMTTVLKNNGYEIILNYPELLGIAQGSPGEAIAAYEQLQSFPEALKNRLNHLPKTPIDALELAKILAQELDTQTQLWLVDYLQYSYWQKWKNQQLLKVLEKTRQGLLAYVQPRLVWECTWLEISNHFDAIKA
ncbi:DNA polymerase III subunit delta' [Gloeothece verrucosa]|uniref:DNA polymerase III, delta prime subunit n=1 Tax=Gloeothece verrucosa (strain PCC 7822) TaxID=497965 RepID=E0U5U1_GLOV7|nr:DNA polymerase III subunit delta' [Gloeothece verrucosa]ADN15932.1 DNA polymerase III, delta prime subunit [Gloeothece verrucosa PCC 7822]